VAELKAQQLEVKCGKNTIIIDSSTKVQRNFFECDSISFRVTNLQGEYSLSFAKLNKKTPMVLKGSAANNKPFKLFSTFLTIDYDDLKYLIVVISQNNKYVKGYKLLLNYRSDSYK
jgi:hypothetical protein